MPIGVSTETDVVLSLTISIQYFKRVVVNDFTEATTPQSNAVRKP